MHMNDLDPIFIVPLSAVALGLAIAAEDPRHGFVAGDKLVVRNGDMVVLESIEEMPAGTVVRLAPMMGDAHELASFIDDREGAETLIACEEAAGLIEDIILRLDGMAAGRERGRWKPFDMEHRQTWGRLQGETNARRMRERAANDREAKVDAYETAYRGLPCAV